MTRLNILRQTFSSLVVASEGRETLRMLDFGIPDSVQTSNNFLPPKPCPSNCYVREKGCGTVKAEEVPPLNSPIARQGPASGMHACCKRIMRRGCGQAEYRAF